MTKEYHQAKAKEQYLKRETANIVYMILTPLGTYIGRTQNIILRMSQHRTSMRHQNTRNFKANPLLYKAMKQGYQTFQVYQGTREDCLKLEKKLIPLQTFNIQP